MAKTPPPDAPMPPSTQRAHFEPAWKGDRLIALDQVAARPPGPDGINAIDCNFQWFWNDPKIPAEGGEAFALHYAAPGRNNFTYINAGNGRVREMTRAELRRRKWRPEQVRRWRRGPTLDSASPKTYRQMAAHAVEVGATITGELKSPAFRRHIPARHVVTAAKQAGHPPWFMALYGSMPFASGKCAAIIGAGGEFAVIFGRYQSLRAGFRKAVKTWPVKPTQVW